MVALFLSVVVLALCGFGVSEEEFGRDEEYVKHLEMRLEELDREIKERGPVPEVIGELNSYGYPLYNLRTKYSAEPRYREFYERVSNAYEKLLFVKRGALPHLLRREMERAGVRVCDVSVGGRERRTLTVVMEDPSKEEEVIKVMTETQLQYAHLLGIEEINFKKCD